MAGLTGTVELADSQAPIARLFYDSLASSLYGYTEQIIYSITNTTAYSELLLYGSVGIVADNGASAATGTIQQSACQQPTYTQMQFCYTITNTLTTSPWLPWTVSVSGLMNVSTFYTPGEYGVAQPSGYLVQSITGTRTMQWQGKTSTRNIVGVAPINAYNYNDNIINLASPFLARSYHSVSFMLDGPAAFADGYLPNNSPYVNINGYNGYSPSGSGVTESDLPENDGAANVVVGSFQMRFDFFGTLGCGLPGNGSTDPLYTPPTSTQLTQFNTAGPQMAFCWSHTGGPGGDYVSANGAYWQITSSGVMTLAGYLGTTGTGRQARKIVSVTGSRTYQFENGTSQVVPFTLGAVNAMANYTNPGGFEVGSFSTNFYGNNILYTSYPELDRFGVVLQGSGIFDEETESVNGQLVVVEGSANDRAIRVMISYQNLLEYIWDPPTRYIWTNNAGYSQFQAYAGQNLTTYGQQCYYLAGTPTQLSYCYWLSGSSPMPWTTQTYGLMIANGPSLREGGQAYAVSSMSGVRNFTMGGVSYITNVLNVQFPQQDLYTNTANDNLVYVPGTTNYTVDYFGLTFTLRPWNSTSPLVGARGTVALPDIEVWTDLPAPNGDSRSGATIGFVEGSASYYPSQVWQTSNLAASAFQFGAYSAGGALQQCSAPASVVPAVPALTTYSFCYGTQGSFNTTSFTLGTYGSISVYNTPMTVGGRTAYAVAAVSGTRQFSTSNGYQGQTPITGGERRLDRGGAGLDVRPAVLPQRAVLLHLRPAVQGVGSAGHHPGLRHRRSRGQDVLLGGGRIR